MRCPSCKPERHRIDYPGGWVWRHQASCALYPKQRLGDEKKHDPEQEARRLHPAGKTETGNYPATNFSKGFDGWHRQPQVGPMIEAVQYVDDHLDDELEEAES
jgi:hypothetical protein